MMKGRPAPSKAPAPEPEPEPETVTFIPAVDFLGYPDGKTGVNFKAGAESIPVSPDYAALIRQKGLARAD